MNAIYLQNCYYIFVHQAWFIIKFRAQLERITKGSSAYQRWKVQTGNVQSLAFLGLNLFEQSKGVTCCLYFNLMGLRWRLSGRISPENCYRILNFISPGFELDFSMNSANLITKNFVLRLSAGLPSKLY